jgi:glycosyltransferase involved in cell wall biosynthesis
MKILIINHYSGSSELGMAYRHYYFARELQTLGHEVLIIASRYSHLRISQPETSLQEWAEHCGIPHLWLAGCEYEGNGARRLLNMAGFAADLWRNAARIARQQSPDIVLASSPHPFCSYGAAKIARLAGARFIFEIRDLWPLSLMELGSISASHPLIRMLDHAETYGCKRADKVVSLLPCVHEYMVQRKVPPARWMVIPNGVVPDEWQEPWPSIPQAVERQLSALKNSGKHIVGYAGAHGLANALDTLIDAAALMHGSDVAFVLVGGGPEKAGLQQRVSESRLDNIHFIDPVRKDQIPALLQWFDIAYIGWNRQPLYRFGIAPNKLMDYMMAGRPVLHAVEAGNDAVSEAGCGVTVMPECAQEIVRGIRSLFALSAAERDALGRRGREFVMRNHAYPELAQRLLKACA